MSISHLTPQSSAAFYKSDADIRGLTYAGNCDARDAKIKRVASDQRLKDMEMAHAASLNSSEGGLPSSSQLAGSAGHLSASHLSAAAADQVGVCRDVCAQSDGEGKVVHLWRAARST